MKKSDELKQLRHAEIESVNAIIETAEGESRDFNDKENSQIEKHRKEIARLDDEIKRAEQIEELKRRSAEAKGKKQEKRNADTPEGQIENYSLVKAVREMTTGGLSGLEKEMHEETLNRSRAAGVAMSGLGVPTEAFAKRAINSTTTGTDALHEPFGGFIEALRPRTRVLQLGATFMPGLSGDVRMAKQTTAGGLTWEGENDDAADSGAVLGGFTLSPHRGAAYTEVSKQFLNQTAFSAEQVLRDDLLQAVAIGIDAAAINGSGSSGQPEGILNFTDLNTVAIGTNGGAPTWAKVVELESAVDDQNAPDGMQAYLTTPIMRGKLKTTSKDAGSGLFIWGGNEVNGYTAAASTNVPSTLVKGTSSDCHAIIYSSNWSQLMIGQWGGIDLVVDPYTQAKKAMVVMTVNVFVDVKARNEEAFAAIKDARNV
jgi:HK97 family phage major capsid protein